MPAELNYKNLLNLFVDRTKSYSLDTKTRLEDLYYQNSMGLVEEFMVSRNFSFGTLGSGNRNLVGIPKDVIDDTISFINDQCDELVKITGSTTGNDLNYEDLTKAS